MRNLTVIFTACLTAALSTLASHAAQAQDNRWFKVEVLVFANKAPPPGGATAEQWAPLPELAYPNAARFLIDPQLVASNAAEFDGDSKLDEFGRQIITIATGGVGTDIISPPVAATPAPVPTVPGQTLQPVINPTTAAPVAPTALPRPFVMLPQTYREFAGKADQLQRSGRYGVLFHQSWVQPLGTEADSLPIVLDRSGDIQQWPLLQGSVKVYLARYLHLETKLWLNTSGEYLAGNWRMPAPPLGPPSLIIEEISPVELMAPVAELPTAAAAAGAEVAEVAQALEPAPPVYPYRHAILLEQKRRMRSSEVHYIDHPLLGMIVKFTPVTADELAGIAAAQAGMPGL